MPPLLTRARAILTELEDEGRQRVEHITSGGAQIGQSGEPAARQGRRIQRLLPSASDGQLQLFEPGPELLDPAVKAVLDEVRSLDPNSMTPLQALDTVEKLVKKAKGA